eukprot:1161990-Pelagomonas_calceolata.AAC.1
MAKGAILKTSGHTGTSLSGVALIPWRPTSLAVIGTTHSSAVHIWFGIHPSLPCSAKGCIKKGSCLLCSNVSWIGWKKEGQAFIKRGSTEVQRAPTRLF